MAVNSSSNRSVWIYPLLALLVFAAYSPILHNGFVNFDDNVYVYENPHVLSGLNLAGLKWVWGTAYASNWHPITWLSHMLDCQLYGLKPAGHHVTSLLLHLASALLLLAVLKRMTGSLWCSTLVAAFFALHPLRVESVAWVAERKDVLSVFFLMLTLLAYTHHVQKSKATQKIETPGPQSLVSKLGPLASGPYCMSLLFFALGLMSKPMLVTLPVLLLLLDYWPLRRFTFIGTAGQSKKLRPLVLEKLPFFAMAAASCAVTLWAQTQGDAIRSLARVPWELRFSNVFVSYVRYLGKIFWPTDLAVLYPLPDAWPGWLVATSCLLLGGVTVVTVVTARRYPFLLVGWSWYLLTLVPVIGLVQVGRQSIADRYTYMPSIGLFIAVVWALREIANRRPRLRMLLVVVAAVCLTACDGMTWLQLHYWKNSKALFAHAAKVTTRNFVAHSNLGWELMAEGKLSEAIAEYDLAVQYEPNEAGVRADRAMALAKAGRYPEAITSFQTALQLKPEFVLALKNLGVVLGELGRYREAAVEFERLVQLTPQDADAQFNLALAFRMSGQSALAVPHYRATLRLKPDQPEALNDLAWILATHSDPQVRNGAEAVQLAERLRQVAKTPNALFLITLSAAYAEAGHFTNAVNTAEQARDLAQATGESELAQNAVKCLASYRAGKPYRSQ